MHHGQDERKFCSKIHVVLSFYYGESDYGQIFIVIMLNNLWSYLILKKKFFFVSVVSFIALKGRLPYFNRM